MKVLFVNTFKNYGGAAIAARRLEAALRNQGVEVSFAYYTDKESVKISPFFGSKLINKLFVAIDRLFVKFRLNDPSHLFKYSSGRIGSPFFKKKKFEAFDVIHLHWTTFSFLSVHQINELAKLKPVIWTLHDMWAFTGGCHYSMGCINFESTCKPCPFLKGDGGFSQQEQSIKSQLLSHPNIQIVTCSNWLASQAMRSEVFKGTDVRVIGNTIDTNRFKPLDRESVRLRYGLNNKKFKVLTGAIDLTDERKGSRILEACLKLLPTENVEVLIFGGGVFLDSKHDIVNLGKISNQEELVEIYNLADVFVLPSLQDNLPNTVLESLSCGTPVVAFNSGGVVDMIDHEQNGFICKDTSAEGLLEGILFFLTHKDRSSFNQRARKAVCDIFNQQRIGNAYVELYQERINSFCKHLASSSE